MRRGVALLILALLSACGAEPSRWVTRTPAPLPLTEPLKNPERGFYLTGLDLFDPEAGAALDEIAAAGVTLVYPYDTWLPRDRALTAAELETLKANLYRLRSQGLKLVLRFRYGEDGDADLGLIERHLGQLLPVVRENADLVYVFQAGFLGRWGEWHCWRATAICHDDAETKAWLLDQLLKELPPELPIAVRYPAAKVRYLGLPTDHPPKRPLFGRIAHHNDCWLASETDNGTYPEQGAAAWRVFVYTENDRLPYGGETCAKNPPRTDGAQALAEAAAAHLDYLNREYHEGVLKAWKKDGTYAAFAARLGYRIGLVRARWPEEAPAGRAFVLELTLKNTGFARLKRRRTAYLVFDWCDELQAVPLPLDLTELGPGETRSWRLKVTPPDLDGVVRLGLWFPDPSKRLKDDPRYAIRLASRLDFVQGVNWLGDLTLR